MIEKPAPPIAGVAAKPRRSTARDATFLKADLKRTDGTMLEGLRVRNLSSGGLMVETPELFEEGEPLAVVLRNVGAVPSRVAWMAKERVGIAFEKPIRPSEVRRAPAKSPGATMELLKPVSEARRPGLKAG